MKQSKYFIIFIIIFVIFLSGCTFGKAPVVEVEKGPVPVVTENVQFKTIAQGERFIGKISADKNSLVYPKITAKIEKIYVKPGDTVVKNQILMKLDDRYVNDSLHQAESSYQSALINLSQAEERQKSSIIQTEAQLAIAEDSYNQAVKNLVDITKKYDDGVVTESQLDQAEATFVQAETNLTNAKAALATATAAADAAYAAALILDPSATRDPNLTLSINSLTTSVALAEAAVQQSKAALDSMTAQYNGGKITENQVDQSSSVVVQAENNLKIARDSAEAAKSNSNIEAATLAVEQAEYGIEQAKRSLEDTKVYSSIAGQVVSVKVEEGDMATPQAPAMQIINQGIVYVSLNVTENTLKNFNEGDIINIYIPSLERDVEGKATFISPIANEQTLTFLVEIEINNDDKQLKSGMLVETILSFSNDEEYIIIPTRAVMGTGKETYVYVVEDGKAYKRAIEVMDMATEETILISGLTVDDVIVIKGQYSLEDGEEVEIVK